MSSFSLTLQQKVAIEYKGSMVITACPGSGKTTVIAEKIREITPDLPGHKGVIAITYTKKASLELKNRCLLNAYNVKQSYFGTIDSFCLNELILPFLSRIWGGVTSECKIVKKLNSPYVDYLVGEYKKTPSLQDLNTDNGFKRLYDDGILWMNSFSAIALYILNESTAAQRYIKAKYSHVFIDEYQDSSEAQHQLFLWLFEYGLIATAVGDTSQSIFEFRGGNPDLLSHLVSDIDNFKHFEIDINHRSHPSIINYASRLLDPLYILIPCENICVFRRKMEGSLTNIAQEISQWITDWLRDNTWSLCKASEVVLLATKESSLKLLASGLGLNYRLYSVTPLDSIGSDCSDLYSDLLAFKFGAISTVQELIDKKFYFFFLKEKNRVGLRKMIRALRDEHGFDSIIAIFQSLALILDLSETVSADNAVREVLSEPMLIKQFKPLDQSEVQLMTLHKSKGLEFKVVFHFDLEEWSFPFQKIINNDWDNPLYPTLKQDTNLHYVGITRAENCCVLISAKRRQKVDSSFTNSKPSYFIQRPELEGLYN
jgi:superfamily I DNA/RNA helicase